MAILASYAFKTLPGRFSRHLALMLEARDRLQKMGYRAACLNAVVGADFGAMATVLSFENAEAWAQASHKVNSDPEWQKFYAAFADEGVCEALEGAVFSDLDPAYKPQAYGTLKVFRNTLWRAIPGHTAELMTSIESSLVHIKRHGGTPRVSQCIEGNNPMTISVSVGFKDLAASGAHLDALNADTQFQAYWARVMAKPSAELVRAGTYEMMN